MSKLNDIYKDILNDKDNQSFIKKGYKPIYSVSKHSKIIIIGQAPGIKAQEKGVVWLDKSGDKLREWLGVSFDEFYNEDNFALIPMDFFYPGKRKSGGDLAPRKSFSEKWHPLILKQLKEAKLIILSGSYSQKYYLKDTHLTNLTENVKNYKNFLPKYFPIPHPSPLNFRWLNKNKWFEKEVIPELKNIVNKIIKG